MITTYAFGRNPLPSPILSRDKNSGDFDINKTYYFWLQGKNFVGYSKISPVASITLKKEERNSSNVVIYQRDRSIVVEGISFQQYEWEDWKEFYLYFSETNDIQDARIIYKRNNFDDQQALLPLSSFTISSPYILEIPKTVGSPSLLPTGSIPEGFRIRVASLSNQVYEFTQQALTPNGVTVLAGVGGVWKLLLGGNLIETDETVDLLVETIPQSLIKPIQLNSLSDRKSIKYYLINNNTFPITGEIILNHTASNPANLNTTAFNIKKIGYLNLNNFTLSTPSIPGIGVFQPYNNQSAEISVPLPSNHALVLEVEIDLTNTFNILQGTQISLCPKIRYLSLLETPKYWDKPVDNLSILQSLLPEQVIAGQIRYVVSKRDYYYYDPSDSRPSDGDYIITPAGLPGRWSRGGFSIPENSIGFQNLTPSLREKFSKKTKILFIEVNTVGQYTLDITNTEEDYVVIRTPPDNSLVPWEFNITHTQLQEFESREIIVEFNYRTAPVTFSPLILFPGNTTPLISGNNNKDIFVFQVQRLSGTGIIRRGFVYGQET